MNLLRATRCINVYARSSPRYVSPAVSQHTRLKQAPRRFYSEEKGKEKESNPSQNDSSRTNSLGDNLSTTKTESEAADSQKPNREGEFLAQLQAKQDEITELTGRLRYAQADFINLQRISAREKEQTKEFAISRFATDLLETADTLTMALRSASSSSSSSSKTSTSDDSPPLYFQPSTQTTDALLQGVEATYRILIQTFAKYGIKPFDPTGEVFDPNRHEAMYSVPVPGKKAGEVLDCQKLGYTIKDRVLRAAQVGVVSEPTAEPAKDS